MSVKYLKKNSGKFFKMKKYENENCNGCALLIDNVLCCRYNDGSCPCTICLMKMMNCDPDYKQYLSCDIWVKWFGKTNKLYERRHREGGIGR